MFSAVEIAAGLVNFLPKFGNGAAKAEAVAKPRMIMTLTVKYLIISLGSKVD